MGCRRLLRGRSPAAESSSSRALLTNSGSPEGGEARLGPDHDELLQVLGAARYQGFLGPGPVATHVAHSLAFACLVASPPAIAVDLGSGGGVPGLVLAKVWPASTWVLLDANHRRTDFLRQAARTLRFEDRVVVVTERAEVFGQDGARRATADLVVARAFGPPAVTAECAAPLLRTDGLLVVAEPPGGEPDRWPEMGLQLLGLIADGRMASPIALQRLRLTEPCPSRYPRRTGIPQKRPLF